MRDARLTPVRSGGRLVSRLLAGEEAQVVKVMRIRPYGRDYDRHGTVSSRQCLCYMSDGTLLVVSVAARYRGNAKNHAVREQAIRIATTGKGKASERNGQ